MASKCTSNLFLISAVNISQAYIIVGEYILNYCGKSAKRCKYDNKDAIKIQVGKKTNYIIFAGGKNQGSGNEIQGLSLAGVYFTEINLLNPDFIKQAIKRTGDDTLNAFFFATLNPLNEEHFFYKEFLDQWEKEEGKFLNYMHVTLEDGPNMTPEKIAEFKRGKDPDSVEFQRDYLGLRVSAEGLIYKVNDYNIIDEFKPEDYIEYVITADPGENCSATVFQLIALHKGYTSVDVLKNYYHRNKDNKNNIKFPKDYANDLIDFLLDCSKLMDKWPRWLYIDQDITFYRELQKAFMERSVNSSIIKYAIKDDIDERIKQGQNLLYSGKLRFYKGCGEVIRAFKSAQYDEKESLKGKYIRLDKPEEGTLIDDCDACEYGFRHYIKQIYYTMGESSNEK